MDAYCKGRFNAADEEKLRIGFEKLGWLSAETFEKYCCDICGVRGLTPEKYGGQWRPNPHVTHKTAKRRRVIKPGENKR